MAGIAVVMNNGIIEQFGHLLIFLINQKTSLLLILLVVITLFYKIIKNSTRMDQIKVIKTKKSNHNTMTIKDLEFQGENVKLICSNKGNIYKYLLRIIYFLRMNLN